MSSETQSEDASPPPVRLMFHPTIHVTSLEESEEFFDRVFSRPSTLLEVMPAGSEPRSSDQPKGYSKFTPIAEVLIDCVDPTLHVTDGVQHFESVEKATLFNLGWYCDDIFSTYRVLKAHGIPMTSQFGTPAEGDEPPTTDQGGNLRQFYLPPDQMGLRYQFLPWMRLPMDHRSDPEWTLPPVSEDDPLGIERLSHHVILTKQPERAKTLTVDALKGTVIHEGRDEARGIAGPYVQVADAVIHYAMPDQDTPAAEDLATRLSTDKYHAMTWKVADLDRVERHLQRIGLPIVSRTMDTIVTSAEEGLGVAWGFTTKLVPGDTLPTG
ncbi:hypothetical protein LRP67_20495 [Nocardioides sp. cx-169]|uniref:hypothetical protein n=1 Tax=Nocardioides sp. cx-169 TaxID=2899080 RepID=UPI001E2F87EF|nr:hypothetical protein [Nocardioides sp. cx-169]MCD4536480.1 hypothetical protein [Nocardioides sp. cx-169]